MIDRKFHKFRKAGRILGVLAHLSRALLLVAAMSSFGAAYIWAYRPDVLDSLEKKIRANHTGRFNERNNRAENLLNNMKLDEARSLLSTNLSEMGEVRKLDSLKKPYASTLVKLLRIARTKNDIQGAVDITGKLVELDHNSYNYNYDHGMALFSAGRIDEGERFLLRANSLAPTQKESVDMLLVHYMKTGRRDKARALLSDYLDANRHLSVILQFLHPRAGGKPISLASEALPVTGKTQTLRLEASAKKVRLTAGARLMLYFPGKNLISMEVGPAYAWTYFGRQTLDMAGMDYDLKNAVRTGNEEFRLEGGWSTIAFKIPESLNNMSLSKLNMDVKIRPALSQVMQSVYKDLYPRGADENQS